MRQIQNKALEKIRLTLEEVYPPEPETVIDGVSEN